MRTPSRVTLEARLCVAALCLLLPIGATAANPLANPSVDDLERLLSAPQGSTAMGRSLDFRRTAPPDAVTGLCPGMSGSSGSGAGGSGRNLVAYAAAAPGVNLAIHFASGSDRLSPSDIALLDNLAAVMQRDSLREARFSVSGHTDITGGDRINQPLSCARALAAREYLIMRGIAPHRLTAYGFGSSRLLDRRRADARENRRVEIRREAK